MFVYLNSNYFIVRFIHLLTCIAFCLLLGCAQKNSTTQIDHLTMENNILQSTVGEPTEEGDSLNIREVKLSGNILTVSVTYYGGCLKHTFSLIGSPNISKSLPPRRSIRVIHQDQGDQCKKTMMEDLHFDLSELAHKKENGSRIWLDLEGWKYPIDYNFKEN